MRVSNPLYTERIIIRAILPIPMPTALMSEIMFITLCDFFANRYLPAMKNGKRKAGLQLFFQQFIYVFNIIERRVLEKYQFRNNSQLFCYQSAQIASDGF